MKRELSLSSSSTLTHSLGREVTSHYPILRRVATPTLSTSLLTTLLLTALIISCVSSAWARPTTRVVSRVEGDASVSLSLENQYIEGDSQIPCEISVEVLSENRPFTEGDTILIRVREDDSIFGDDTLWETEIVVDEAIVEVGLFTMTYDCSFPAIGDQFGDIEIYAKVEVDKDDCGFVCESTLGEDTPSTPNVYMREVTDDDAEDDDESASAFEEPTRLTADRVARDPDWFVVEYGYSVELLARLESNLNGGDLDLKLYDAMLNLIAEAAPETGGTSKSLRPPSVLSPGRYWLEVTPVDPENYNFYDLYIVESQVMVSCPPGELETRPCGLCGREERTCGDSGEWGSWSMCLGAGVCEPGEEESVGCEEGGSRARICDAACQWGPYTECIECEDGAMESCYTGAPENAGVGACVEGTRVCSRGQWSSCQGDVLPRDEACLDAIDNDCNGFTDSNDPACLADLGDACERGACGEQLECLQGPFAGGYCGGSDCASCPAGSVCAQVSGQDYCLKPCADSTACRGGYGCAPLGRAGESVCAPLCSGDQDCVAGEVCNAARYCEESATPQGQIGAACAQSSECAAPLECLMSPFTGGYCGGRGCAQCAAMGGVCGSVEGQPFCLQSCASVADCRAGYLCVPAGNQGELTCAPPCMSDAACGAGYLCNAQGYCELGMSPPGGAPSCGEGGPCLEGQRCMMNTETGALTCVDECVVDTDCAQGYVCGADQLCQLMTAVTPEPTPAQDEGCEQRSGAQLEWIASLLALFALLTSRRRSYSSALDVDDSAQR